MSTTRRNYDKEFKLMAVNLCLTGKTASEVARELGIKPDLVSRWKREYSKHKEGSFSGHGNENMTEGEKEINRLKKELKEAELERDILKKAISIFSKGGNKYTDL